MCMLRPIRTLAALTAVCAALLLPASDLRAQAVSPEPAPTVAVYRASYIRSDRLVATLKELFKPEQLQVVVGPDEYSSPGLDRSTAKTLGGGGASSTPAPSVPPAGSGAGTRAVILMGGATQVATALDLCRQLDVPRKQVRFSVKITNFDYAWLRTFGASWNWSKVNLTEASTATSGAPLTSLSLGILKRNPLFVEAAISASESKNSTALKAIPSITVLDGDQGYILIGERYLYPKLTGYTQAQTPIYDKEEVQTGIYLSLGVQVSQSDDMVLTLFPQVSSIIGYLDANGASYPQIATMEQQTSVRVRDGETVVIGGLLNEREITRAHGIPGLMHIPFLGRLFRSDAKDVRTADLVVMITAEIVKDGGVQ